MKPWTKYTRCHFINFVQKLFYVLRHLIIGPGPCNFEILKYRLFLESVRVGKQELGLVSDPALKGHKIPPSSSIYTSLRASFRLWVLFRLKVRHSCNFAYFVCVQRPDQGVTDPPFINKAFLLYSQYPDCSLSFLLVLRLLAENRPS